MPAGAHAEPTTGYSTGTPWPGCDDAVRALRTAEDLFPTKVRRDPMVRDAIATLLPGARRNAIGMELRGLAHRANLPM